MNDTIHTAEADGPHQTDVAIAEPEEQIRVLAHSKWAAAGCPPGDGVEFWLEAEQELNAEPAGSSSAPG
jgi:hypothetical protein